MARPHPALMLPLLVLLSCESGTSPAPGTTPPPSPVAPKVEQPLAAQPAPAPAAAPPAAGGVQRFGGTISAGPEATLAQLLTAPEKFKSADVITAGTVRRACSRKGCWMELAQGDDPGCRVTFKDYGFFVPTDSAGARARVQGRLETQSVPASRVRHLEAEGAQFASKNPDGSATEVTLVATAVELTR
jgi:uncharacterized protein DUF4920